MKFYQILWVSVFQLSSLSKWNFQNCTYNTYFGQFLLLSYCFKRKGLNPFLTNLKVFVSTINDQWSINQTKLNKQMAIFLAKRVFSCLFIHWKWSRSLLSRQLWLRSKWSCLTNKFTNILVWNAPNIININARTGEYAIQRNIRDSLIFLYWKLFILFCKLFYVYIEVS